MLNIGDVVQLNSGSLSMTVVKILNAEYISAAWFYEGSFKVDDFPIKALTIKK